MPVTFYPVRSLDRLNELFEESHTRPVVLFKHSNSCGISSVVMREISNVDAEMHLVVVQTERIVADAIENRTNIRHQSPQAIVLKNGIPVYHASHYDITPEALEHHIGEQ
jgi:bacillithiol system protein YtxJ